MEYSDIGTVAAWLTEQGLKGASESELLTGFCNTCREFGLPLDRGMALMDTLHPVHEGRAFRWDSQAEIGLLLPLGRQRKRGAPSDRLRRSDRFRDARKDAGRWPYRFHRNGASL